MKLKQRLLEQQKLLTLYNLLKMRPICILEGTLQLAFIATVLYFLISQFYYMDLRIVKKTKNTNTKKK